MHRIGARRLPQPPSYKTLFGPDGSEWRDTNRKNVETISRDLLMLPEDVVSQIFVYACQPIFDFTHNVNPIWRRAFYPLWLGRICRAWRDCAWGSSELWTTIIIHVTPKKAVIQNELLQEWIERAKGRPLDVYIGQLANPSDEFLALLSKYSEQWQHVNFCLPSRRYQCFSNEPLRLPILRSASLRHTNKLVPRGQRLELDLNYAPLLRTLSLSHLSFSEPDTLSFYPTKKITHLSLSSSSSVDLRFLLGQFCNLKEFTLVKCGFFRHRGPNTRVQHDHLEVLDVEFDSHIYFDSFFLQLSLR